jgi:coenzyme F420-reducing hydrogenase beta subunit
LKRTEDKNLGSYCDIFSAKSGVEGQDGGIVTALLLNGFAEDLFDSAIVVQSGEGYKAKVVEAKNNHDVLLAKGSKYLRANVTQKLRELISAGKKRVAIVCTPCEAKLARNIAQNLKRDYEIVIIGLFCLEAFNKDRLKDEIKILLGVNLDEAEKTQIRQGKFTITVDGKEYYCKVKDLIKAIEKKCRYCDDFSAQLADISVGSVGSKEGYSSVIVRTKVGEKMLKNFESTKEMVDKEEIIKLSKFMRTRAKKNLATSSTPK